MDEVIGDNESSLKEIKAKERSNLPMNYINKVRCYYLVCS